MSSPEEVPFYSAANWRRRTNIYNVNIQFTIHNPQPTAMTSVSTNLTSNPQQPTLFGDGLPTKRPKATSPPWAPWIDPGREVLSEAESRWSLYLYYEFDRKTLFFEQIPVPDNSAVAPDASQWPWPAKFFDETANQITERNAKESAFLRLPKELRWTIYQYVIADSDGTCWNRFTCEGKVSVAASLSTGVC
ncbi:uncharacterized protein J4E79_009957 [Alternaria viburni]|uniref:uncharacterized protein n=1 Tax=Alternaria viburni TaxID=566460 RepID=UPI0020C356D8|nr:uncharacterized protein J4E79_009957 [Alternaria viburni]KAI4648885.1 hypothetical protein J4E79_009957 [Alternaria viburni]